jgi:hypothetical protein
MITALTIASVIFALAGFVVAFLIGDDEPDHIKGFSVKSATLFYVSIYILLLAFMWKINPFW